MQEQNKSLNRNPGIISSSTVLVSSDILVIFTKKSRLNTAEKAVHSSGNLPYQGIHTWLAGELCVSILQQFSFQLPKKNQWHEFPTRGSNLLESPTPHQHYYSRVCLIRKKYISDYQCRTVLLLYFTPF